MEAPDPLLEQEPDFLSEQFRQARDELAALNIPEDTITNALRQAWSANRQARHEAWAAGRQEEPQQEEEIRRQDEPEQADDEGTQTKAQKAKTFPVGITVPDAESPRPSEYTRQKCTKFEYVELWYFSREGLAEAARPTTSTSNDMFGIITGELGAVQLCPVATTKASKNAIADEALSWDQVSFASKVYIEALRGEKWPEQHIRALIQFFSELDFQRTRLTSIPDKAFIEYQATVRREWMDTWSFDISGFSLSRLQAIQSRVTMHAHQAALVSDSLTAVTMY